MTNKLFPKESSLKKEIDASAELANQLGKHSAKWSSIQSQIFELGAKEWEVLQEANKQRSIGNYKRIAELNLEYNKIHAENFRLKYSYDRERDNLFYQLGLLTTPAIKSHCNQLDDLVLAATKAITTPTSVDAGSVYTNYGDMRMFRCFSNFQPILKIIKVILDGRGELRSMTHNSISEIDLAFNSIIETIKAMPTDDIDYGEMSQENFGYFANSVDEYKNGPKRSIPTNDFGRRLDDLNYNLVQSSKQNSNWMEIESIKSEINKLKG